MLALSSLAAAAFSPAGVPARAPAHQIEMIERSAAIPFLKRPPAPDGSLVGDIGFDPLGFTTTITELGGDLNYVREAELTHGRMVRLTPRRLAACAAIPLTAARASHRRCSRASACGSPQPSGTSRWTGRRR